MGMSAQHHAQAALTWERDHVLIVQEAAWAPRIRPEGYGKSSSHWDLTASTPRTKKVCSEAP
jgi:hypothetical protein